MRHLRMVGVCLIAVFAISAMAAVPAMAKEKFNVNTYQQFKHCPFGYPGITDCIYGATSGGATGGYFQYGHVLTKLSKPIVIQVGAKGSGTETESTPPEDGALSLESPPEPIVKGLKVITPAIQAAANWPEALKTAFAEAVKNKETKATATIEMAGNECFAVQGCINTESLLGEEFEPPAFRLPLKVTVNSPFLEKLGGSPCQIGSDENPIKQKLSTGGPGRPGELHFEEATFEKLIVESSQLIDISWHIPKVSGAHGCGGPYEEYVDKALNLALDVEYANGEEIKGRTGVTVLTGNLYDSNAEKAKQKLEEGSK